MNMKTFVIASLLAVLTIGFAQQSTNKSGEETLKKVVKTDAEWKKKLTTIEYRILRQSGTEPAYTGRNWNNHKQGKYACAGCGTILFSSETKFDSGTGWPSFYAPLAKNVVSARIDKTLGMVRDEVNCAVCDGHLGHVFDDGPKPTGLRYCMNGYALKFIPKQK